MSTTRLGLLSALLASLCCVGPLLLLALGLGSLGLGALLGRYHWGFTAVAIVLLATGWRESLKERHRCRIQQCQMVRGGVTKWTLMAASMLVATFTGLNIYSTFAQPALSPRVSSTPDSKTAIIPTKGMTCAMCEFAIEQRLAKHPGVLHVDAQAAAEQVVVTYDARKIDLRELMAVIDQAGYRTQAPAESTSP